MIPAKLSEQELRLLRLGIEPHQARFTLLERMTYLETRYAEAMDLIASSADTFDGLDYTKTASVLRAFLSMADVISAVLQPTEEPKELVDRLSKM